MPLPCGRPACPQPMASALAALMAEPGFSGTRLAAAPHRIAADLPRLGAAVAVTLNSAAVMTRIGCYGSPQAAGEPLALDRDAGTCLRLHAPAVETALAVDRMPMSRQPFSLQFFGEGGVALHKAFLTDCRDDLDFARLTHGWEVAAAGAEPPCPAIRRPSPAGCGAAQIDSLFGDCGLTRRASLPGWGGERAWRVRPDPACHILARASEVRLPLVMTVANAAAAQVHCGAPETVRRSERLVVVTSGTCTLSIDQTEVEEAWITCFDAGGRTGLMLELYDWRCHCVAQFSAAGGEPGLAAYWSQLLVALPQWSSPGPQARAERHGQRNP